MKVLYHLIYITYNNVTYIKIKYYFIKTIVLYKKIFILNIAHTNLNY